MKLLILALFFMHNVSWGQLKVQRPFEMSWDPVEGASQYEIEMSLKNKIVINKITKQPFWSGEIKPGNYIFRLRSFDRRKVPGPWSAPESLIVYLTPAKLLTPSVDKSKILTKSPKDYELHLSWSKSPLADSYRVQIRNKKTDSRVEVITKEESSAKVKLPVGAVYEVSVIPMDSKGEYEGSLEEAEKRDIELIGAPLNKVKFEAPETTYIRQITWTSDPNAKKFQLRVLRKKTESSWEVISQSEIKRETLDIPLSWPGGRYQLQVKSQAEHFEDSDIAAISFDLHSGDRSEEAQFIAELRSSIEGFNGWYGHASYLITQIDYVSRQRQLSNIGTTSFSTVSGTGRLGFGYLGQQREWGFLTVLDMSGMISQQNKNVIFAAGEIVGMYRTQITERDDLRFKIGWYFKELPFAAVDFVQSSVSHYSNAMIQGLSTGGEYWFSFSPKIGFQTHAYFYLGVTGKTPIYGNSIKSLSSQLGFLGSYKFSKTSAGLIGLASRQDTASFESLDAGGSKMGKSEIDMRGLFLNLVFEQSF